MKNGHRKTYIEWVNMKRIRNLSKYQAKVTYTPTVIYSYISRYARVHPLYSSDSLPTINSKSTANKDMRIYVYVKQFDLHANRQKGLFPNQFAILADVLLNSCSNSWWKFCCLLVHLFIATTPKPLYVKCKRW